MSSYNTLRNIKFSDLSLILFVCLNLVLNQNARSQNELSFNHINVENGLSQNSVISIIQDAKGYMWFGTKYGLNRYDGRNIKIYKNNSEKNNSISSSDFIRTLALDHNHQLWVGSLTGLDKFVPESESFEHVLSNVDISNYVYQDSRGTIWLCTSTGLKHSLDKEHRQFKSIDLPLKSTYEVNTIYEDYLHQIWIGTSVGLIRVCL
jgi:ligand-binding sensor domain-containing protein